MKGLARISGKFSGLNAHFLGLCVFALKISSQNKPLLRSAMVNIPGRDR